VANALDGAVPEPVREERRARFMQVQEAISLDRLKRKIGSRQRVLVDAVTPQGAVARSSADAPEIDGLVYVAPDPRLKAGEFFDVRIESSDAHDLRAVLL
jgi:ribosomal protein S12 methylthiotransferase